MFGPRSGKTKEDWQQETTTWHEARRAYTHKGILATRRTPVPNRSQSAKKQARLLDRETTYFGM